MSFVSKKFEIDPKSELRIQLDLNQNVEVKIEGDAEVFGNELAMTQKFHFSKFAIFSWSGAKITLNGEFKSAFASDSSIPMYSNIHEKLEERRLLARRDHLDGPRILIVGRQDSGKTTLAKVLLGYAVREGETPVYIDMELERGDTCLPGAITVSLLDSTHRYENITSLNKMNTIPFYYGWTTPNENYTYFCSLVQDINNTINSLCEHKSKVRSSGIVINGGNWPIEKPELLKDVITLLNVDCVLVIDQERLYNQIKEYNIENLQVSKLRGSNGAESRGNTRFLNERNWNINKYFYGIPIEGITFQPVTKWFQYNELNIYHYPDQKEVKRSANLYTETAQVDNMKITPISVPITSALNQYILAVTNAQSVDELLHSSIYGFVYILRVNEETQEVQLSLPFTGDLPGHYLIVGTTTWDAK